MSRWGNGVRRAVLATVGACLLVSLVGWAALIGPSQVFAGVGWMGPSERTIKPAKVSPLLPRDVHRHKYGSTAVSIAHFISGVIELAFLAGILYVAFLLLRRVVEAWQTRRRYEAPASAHFDVLESIRTTMSDDADAQLELLLEGAPRNAIVAIWHRFEVQAERSGLPRHGWETPSEFARRMLDVVEVDSPAVTRLLELYREARFSEHELTEVHREAAGEALRTIQSEIRADRPRVRS